MKQPYRGAESVGNLAHALYLMNHEAMAETAHAAMEHIAALESALRSAGIVAEQAAIKLQNIKQQNPAIDAVIKNCIFIRDEARAILEKK